MKFAPKNALFQYWLSLCCEPTAFRPNVLLLNERPAQVEQLMEETARPMGNSAVSGAGLVQALQLPDEAYTIRADSCHRAEIAAALCER